jgi:hypothetical protein
MTTTSSHHHRRLDERRAIGVEWRQKVPLGAHAGWTPLANRTDLAFYAGLCGRTLVRAHARSGDPVSLSGYIGGSTEFARAYADQTEQDWRALLDAVAV